MADPSLQGLPLELREEICAYLLPSLDDTRRVAIPQSIKQEREDIYNLRLTSKTTEKGTRRAFRELIGDVPKTFRKSSLEKLLELVSMEFVGPKLRRLTICGPATGADPAAYKHVSRHNVAVASRIRRLRACVPLIEAILGHTRGLRHLRCMPTNIRYLSLMQTEWLMDRQNDHQEESRNNEELPDIAAFVLPQLTHLNLALAPKHVLAPILFCPNLESLHIDLDLNGVGCFAPLGEFISNNSTRTSKLRSLTISCLWLLAISDVYTCINTVTANMSYLASLRICDFDITLERSPYLSGILGNCRFGVTYFSDARYYPLGTEGKEAVMNEFRAKSDNFHVLPGDQENADAPVEQDVYWVEDRDWGKW